MAWRRASAGPSDTIARNQKAATLQSWCQWHGIRFWRQTWPPPGISLGAAKVGSFRTRVTVETTRRKRRSCRGAKYLRATNENLRVDMVDALKSARPRDLCSDTLFRLCRQDRRPRSSRVQSRKVVQHVAVPGGHGYGPGLARRTRAGSSIFGATLCLSVLLGHLRKDYDDLILCRPESVRRARTRAGQAVGVNWP